MSVFNAVKFDKFFLFLYRLHCRATIYGEKKDFQWW